MADRIEIKVPDIGDFEDVPVIEVLVSEGDEVSEEQSLITLESDKATMEVPSPAAGKIVEMRVKVDDTVSEGDVVAVVEPADGAASAEAGATVKEEAPKKEETPSAEKAESEAAAQEKQTEEKPQQEEKIPGPLQPPARGLPAVDPSKVPYASPAIRRFARELGVDLLKVKGSGQGGRIVREDVTAFVKSALGQPQQGGGGGLPFDLAPPPKVDFSKFGDTEKVELTRIQKLSGPYLHRNWVSIPHVTHNDEADITDMENFRKSSAAEAEAQGFKLTPLVFLIKASVAALRKFPDFNASLDPSGEFLIRKKYFNIGIAVDTPGGLVVPVLRNCQAKGIMELAKELSDVSAKARDGKLTPTDLSGGCFSISSLGGIGGTGFSPIINMPEVAILGVSRHKMSPVWDGEAFKPRLVLPLSLSYDHRVIDGASAARFTRYLASRLEDLRRLTL
ncbi:MAG: dihydrolipoyllysine-residue acetyltransferase [Xanthomonadales bacterium]|nr:dihydrolipoyllysine-residue acetyltransferase [Xanthomonadales bacterium]